jgi:hypothetical protein
MLVPLYYHPLHPLLMVICHLMVSPLTVQLHVDTIYHSRMSSLSIPLDAGSKCHSSVTFQILPFVAGAICDSYYVILAYMISPALAGRANDHHSVKITGLFLWPCLQREHLIEF